MNAKQSDGWKHQHVANTTWGLFLFLKIRQTHRPIGGGHSSRVVENVNNRHHGAKSPWRGDTGVLYRCCYLPEVTQLSNPGFNLLKLKL